MSSEKKVAIITGASQGMGEALVRAYLDRNYRVVATSRSIEPARDPDVLTIQADIGDPESGPRIVAEALKHFGRVDTLINNAGIFLAGPFTAFTAAQYARVLATNLNGFFFTTQAAVKAMEEQGSGHIVQVTTTLVEHAMSDVSSVLAAITKGGLAAATRSLAIEYAKKGIRVNAVAPGVIKTPMHAPETHAFLGGLHPVGRMGEIEDIVKAVLYLESASFVTGETAHVDGGQSAGH
jgi:NAD(P)-dependent dehydrogenase (short-subunit alcohol dehydrogenase family)